MPSLTYLHDPVKHPSLLNIITKIGWGGVRFGQGVRLWQDRTGQGRAGQCSAGQGRAGQGRAGQGSAGYCSILDNFLHQ